MTVTLTAIVLMLALFLGWIVSHTINVRPWVPESGNGTARDRLPPAFTVQRVGLIVFLAAITSLFALTISAYGGRMQMAGDWESVSAPGILWFNTVVLLLSSATFQASRHAVNQGRITISRRWLLLGGGASIVFLAGQALAWQSLAAGGAGPAANPAASFFYFLTALHGVHVLGGLVAWVRAVTHSIRQSEVARLRVSVELCTLYWHYLFVIWLILFVLLLRT